MEWTQRLAKGLLRKPKQPNKKSKASLPTTKRPSFYTGQALGRGIEGCLQVRWRLCSFPGWCVLRKLVAILICQTPTAGPGWCPYCLVLKLLGLIFQHKCKQYRNEGQFFPPYVQYLLFHSLSIHFHWVLVSAWWFPFKLLCFPRIPVYHYFAWTNPTTSHHLPGHLQGRTSLSRVVSKDWDFALSVRFCLAFLVTWPLRNSKTGAHPSLWVFLAVCGMIYAKHCISLVRSF